MPNHFHIVVREKTDGGISKFMQKVTTGYTMYFNKKYERTGSLFEGTFKAQHAADDEYLRYLLTYVHLNPVKLWDPDWKTNGIRDLVKTMQDLDEYKYSSYKEYVGKFRPESSILNRTVLPEYFNLPRDFKSELMDWLTIRG